MAEEDAQTQTDGAGAEAAVQDPPMSDAELVGALSDDAASGSEGQSGDAQGSDAATGDAATQEPMIDIGGEKVPLKDVQAWRDSHGRVTQEFQNVAKMRKDLSPFLNVWNGLKSDKALASAVLGVMEKGKDPRTLKAISAILSGRDPAEALRPPADPVQAKIQTLEERLSAYEQKESQREADAALSSEFSALREGNEELKRMSAPEWAQAQQAIRAFLLEKGREGKWNIPVEIAYDHLSKRNAVAFALQAGQESAAAKAARDRKAPAPKVKAGAASGSGKAKSVADMTDTERYEWLTNRLKG